MGTLTLDDDLLAALKDGLFDLNTAHDLHTARRRLKRITAKAAKLESERRELVAEADAIVTRETEALSPGSTQPDPIGAHEEEQ